MYIPNILVRTPNKIAEIEVQRKGIQQSNLLYVACNWLALRTLNIRVGIFCPDMRQMSVSSNLRSVAWPGIRGPLAAILVRICR